MLAPADAMALYVGSILFLGDQRLFLKVTPMRAKIHAVAAQSPLDRNHFSAARVKPIVNLALGPVFAGSMKLFRAEPG
jgi:hypothetical protein